MHDFSGKTAVVTGAASGVGLALARGLGRAGMNVVMSDVEEAAVKRAADKLVGKQVKTLQVTWKEDIRRWHPGQDWILAAGGFGIFDPGINAFSILTQGRLRRSARSASRSACVRAWSSRAAARSRPS